MEEKTVRDAETMKINEWLFRDAVSDLAELLMKWGFKPKEAWTESEKFWKKHKKKLNEVL